MQIYSDFAGYSLIAIGLALIIGHQLPQNFMYPFLATSVSDFWGRWHITLTHWFRDYVFYPIIKTDKVPFQFTYPIAILVSFLLSGIWHGLGSNFIFWGVVHAWLLIFEQILPWNKILLKIKGGKFLSWLITTFLIMLTMAVFRSQSMQHAIAVIDQLLSLKGSLSHIHVGNVELVLLTGFLVFHLGVYLKSKFQFKIPALIEIIFYILMIPIIIFFRGSENTYVYFHF